MENAGGQRERGASFEVDRGKGRAAKDRFVLAPNRGENQRRYVAAGAPRFPRSEASEGLNARILGRRAG